MRRPESRKYPPGMKLLFYDFQIPDLLKNAGDATGGAAVRQNAIAHGIIKHGHEVGMLTWEGAGEFIGKPLDFDLVESYNEKKGVRMLRFFYYRFPALYRAVKKYQPDFLFHKGSDSPTGVVAFIGQLLNIPFVLMAASDKDADDRYKEVHPLIPQWLYRYGMKKARLIVCQNKYQLQGFRQQFPHKELLLMHNPFFSDQALPEVQPGSERRYIAWIGNFVAVKNVPALYEIALALPDLKFKIAGTRKKNTDENTSKFLTQLEALPNVEFVGYLKRHEVIPFLAKAWALLNTSHLEGFSNTFLEAFAAGTPVVTRNQTDPDQMIEEHQLGQTTQSYQELPATLQALTEDPNFDQIAQRCRQHVVTHHDPKAITAALLDKLKTLTN